MSKNQTLNEMLAGARTPTEMVPVCLRADVLSEIYKLELRIRDLNDADAEDARMASDTGETAHDLASAIRKLEAVAADNTLQLVLRALTKDRWKAAVAARTANDSWNPEETLLDILQESIVEPAMTTDQVQNLLKVITDGQWSKIGTTMLSLNKETMSVPKSLTASAALMDRSSKQKSDTE